MKSGERLYSDNPWTYALCLEQLSEDRIFVGGFSDGIDVYYYDVKHHTQGVSGVLEF